MSLQSGKYGYRPIPASIAEQHYLVALVTVSHSDKPEEKIHIFLEWYILDENALGLDRVYMFKHLSSVNDGDFWNVVLPTLREALNGQSIDSTNPDLKVNVSVTEYEFEKQFD